MGPVTLAQVLLGAAGAALCILFAPAGVLSPWLWIGSGAVAAAVAFSVGNQFPRHRAAAWWTSWFVLLLALVLLVSRFL